MTLTPVQASHPDADIHGCMVELAALFPSIGTAAEAEVRLWECEFAGRPAPLCLDAIRRAKLRVETPFLPLATWEKIVLEIVGEGSVGLTPAEKSTKYMREMAAAAAAAQVTTNAAMAFCTELPADELARLHRQSLERLMLSVASFRRWSGKDPRHHPGQASLVLAEYERERMEGNP